MKKKVILEIVPYYIVSYFLLHFIQSSDFNPHASYILVLSGWGADRSDGKKCNDAEAY